MPISTASASNPPLTSKGNIFDGGFRRPRVTLGKPEILHVVRHALRGVTDIAAPVIGREGLAARRPSCAHVLKCGIAVGAGSAVRARR
jgi:hypothetical protein